MTITDNMRNAAYATMNATQKMLYEDPGQGANLLAIFNNHALPESAYKYYAITVGDVILGFYKPSELPALFEANLHLDSLKALRLAADLANFLAPLTEGERRGSSALGSEIAETEAALQHLTTTRTMAGDAQTLQKHDTADEPPVYQSTQPTLRPGNPLRGPNAPTWGDD